MDRVQAIGKNLIKLSLFFCSTGTKVVMITTGSIPWSTTTNTEILDLENGRSCRDLADFPKYFHSAVGANLQGTPVVCGGYSSSGFHENCYRLDKGKWQEYPSLKEKRGFAAGVTSKDKLHVFGGYGGYPYEERKKVNCLVFLFIESLIKEI